MQMSPHYQKHDQTYSLPEFQKPDSWTLKTEQLESQMKKG